MCCYPKLLVSKSTFSCPRKFTSRYQLFDLNIDFEISKVGCNLKIVSIIKDIIMEIE